MSSVHTLARRAGLGCTVGLLSILANGCSDPATTPPQGAFEVTFGGTSCAATVSPGPTIGIGIATKNETATYADGTEGIRVSCRVVPQGTDLLNTYVKIARSSYSLTFEAIVPTDTAKTVDAKAVAISGPNTSGAPYAPYGPFPCTATYLSGAAGSIKVAFECDSMWNGIGQDSATCSVQGIVAAENCDQ